MTIRSTTATRCGSGAQLIDGKAIARLHCDKLAAGVRVLRSKSITPCLAVILVGADAASHVYVRNKSKAAEGIGMLSEICALPESTSQADLLLRIDGLNRRCDVHGILVQLPLPTHIDSRVVIESIRPEKDVDGLHYANLAALCAGREAFYPCTPLGIMKMLEHERVQPAGLHAVVIGRSNIVSKPMALMLLNSGTTVTVCHSHTRYLSDHTRVADILIVAVGKAAFVDGNMLKPGAIVIDVGINRSASGALCGDVDFESSRQVASRISPVPGGVGPMTIAMLLENTLKAAERSCAKRGMAQVER